MTIAEPAVDGAIPDASRFARGLRAALRNCYVLALSNERELTLSGRIVIELSPGRATARLEDAADFPKSLRDCVVRHVQAQAALSFLVARGTLTIPVTLATHELEGRARIPLHIP